MLGASATALLLVYSLPEARELPLWVPLAPVVTNLLAGIGAIIADRLSETDRPTPHNSTAVSPSFALAYSGCF